MEKIRIWNKHPGSATLPAGIANTDNLDSRIVDSSHVGPDSKLGHTYNWGSNKNVVGISRILKVDQT
jgi:hypothetical protein